jgi:hypothetical protein
MEFFTGALEKYTNALLSKISEDYSLPLEELVAKYQTVPLKKKRAPKKAKDPNEPEVPKVPCVGLTGKGTPCKNKCQPGSDKCHLHGVELPGAVPKVPKEPKVPKVPKTKAKKIQPEHNHPPGSQSDECQLCETHGNVVIPKLPQFESKSLQDRLAAILSSETQETEEPEEPVPAPPSPEPKAKKPRKPKAKAQASPEPEPEAASAVAKPKPKKAKKAKSPEPVAPPPPPPPKPEAVKGPKTASIEERMALILSEEPEEEEEEELDEPESPGAVRHRLIMAEKGLPVEYDEEDLEEDEELNADENDDGFLTEEEFDE